MDFNEYQYLARQTAIYNCKYSIIYPALGLNGEAGEVAEKVKKLIRDDNEVLTEEKRKEISKELSDCLWYLANLACDLNLKLEDIAKENIAKLQSRKNRGVLQGSGDNR